MREALAGRPLRVIFVGRLQQRKRVDLLLKACALVQPSPELAIVGDGPERGALESLAAQVFEKARFLGALFGGSLTRRSSGLISSSCRAPVDWPYSRRWPMDCP